MNGHATEAAPTAPAMPVVRYRKSRRVGSPPVVSVLVLCSLTAKPSLFTRNCGFNRGIPLTPANHCDHNSAIDSSVTRRVLCLIANYVQSWQGPAHNVAAKHGNLSKTSPIARDFLTLHLTNHMK